MCDLYPGKLFDRAPYALDLKKGDLSFTAMSNHFASQSHQTQCRDRRGGLRARQAAETLQQAGKNVLVAGDLNDFEFSTPLATLTQGGVLTQPLVRRRRPAQAYSYKFNGHLQTLDHIAVTAGLKSRLSDMRYIHLDNDVYERMPDATARASPTTTRRWRRSSWPRARARARRARSRATCRRRWR